ncbi:Nuclear transport factor 2 [uncultured virus]|nr:Nuclear transport factor 2 [uncultured virus]
MNFVWNKQVVPNQNLVNTTAIDIRTNFKKITEEFCKIFYATYDSSFVQLGLFFNQNAFITYMDEEFIGFTNLIEKLKLYNIYKFAHHTAHVNSQPIGEKTLLITVSGTLSVNDSIYSQRFMETFFIQRDDQNHFAIYHCIFKLIE